MRLLLILALILLPVATHADDWGHYENGRFGYALDIPPGYEGQGEAANGDGQVFLPASGAETLTVWGGNVIEDDFESEIASRETALEDEGWTFTYRASTPDWVSLSGTNSGHVIYVRAIALCGGQQFAAFQFEYFVAGLAEMNPVVERLVQSFRGTGAGC